MIHSTLILFTTTLFCYLCTVRGLNDFDNKHNSFVYYVTNEERIELREKVRSMFYHGYSSYMEYAFPLDELKPLSCVGVDTLGGYSLTLIDTLDTLVILGNYSEFEKRVRWVVDNVNFDKDLSVSVFETNIRILGGLLSAHLMAQENYPGVGGPINWYNGELLDIALDLGWRLLPAFETKTGIPYGTVNLKYGVPPGETAVTCTAGGGTFSLEFGLLSLLTGQTTFEKAARRAVRALWARRSSINLLGNHIDTQTGAWTLQDAGIGSATDSFYEYLLKGAVLFDDNEYYSIFKQAYEAVLTWLRRDVWYLEANMQKGSIVWPLFSSLQAYWPGLQVLYGDIDLAIASAKAFHNIWKRYGFTPEGYNLITGNVQPNQKGYPLRPELAESIFYLYRATRDPLWLRLGRDMVTSLDSTRVECGFTAIEDVETHEASDRMDSFFLSETLKYLYLLFDTENFINNNKTYIFNTEGHPFPLTLDVVTKPKMDEYFHPHQHPHLPEISLIEQEPFPIQPSGTCKLPSYMRRIASDVFDLSPPVPPSPLDMVVSSEQSQNVEQTQTTQQTQTQTQTQPTQSAVPTQTKANSGQPTQPQSQNNIQNKNPHSQNSPTQNINSQSNSHNTLSTLLQEAENTIKENKAADQSPP